MITTTIITIVAVYIAYRLFKSNKELTLELKQALSKVKSQQVKYGKSFEHFVPFIKDFPADRECTTFLGMPIDLISFDKDTIKFIEVKTGQSQLSPKQKYIQRQIEEGRVEFKELRY